MMTSTTLRSVESDTAVAANASSPFVVSRRFWAILACITALGLAIRVMTIDRHSFWYDEAVTANLTSRSYGALLAGTAKDNGNPPGYLVLAKSWTIMFGDSEVGLRSLSVVLGVLTIPVLAMLGSRLAGATAGLWAAALLAVSPIALELSNEARTYSLVQFAAVACTLAFLKWLQTRHLKFLIAYTSLTFVACYSHYYALSVPAAHGIAILCSPRARQQFFTWLGAMAAAAVAYATWLPAFADQLGTQGNLSRYGSTWVQQFLATPVVLTLGRTFAWRDSSTAMLGLAVFISLATLGAFVVVGLYRCRQIELGGHILAAWLLIPTLGPFCLAVAGIPIYSARYATVALPAWSILAAVGLLHTRPRLRLVQVFALGIATAFSISNYAFQPLKDDWRTAEAIVAANSTPGDSLLFDTDIEVVPYLYYAKRRGDIRSSMVGVIRPPDGLRGGMRGVRFVNGIRVHRQVTECDDAVEGAATVWVLLCVPAGTIAEYTEFLEGRGLILDKSWHVPPRTDIFRFLVSDDSSAGANR